MRPLIRAMRNRPATAIQIHRMSRSAPASQPTSIAACHAVNTDEATPTTTANDAAYATRTPARMFRERSTGDRLGPISGS